MMVSIVLVLTNTFLPTLDYGRNQSLVTCLTECYHNNSCASIFYNTGDGFCYHSFYIHSLDVYSSELQFANNINYYEWTTDSCNNTGWKYHRPSGSCFKFFDDDKKRHEASDVCLQENSTLVDIKDHKKMTFVKDLAATYGHNIWTGGQLVGTTWIWESQSNFGLYRPWKVDHPKDDELCMVVQKDADTWISKKCDSKERFVCETTSSALRSCIP